MNSTLILFSMAVMSSCSKDETGVKNGTGTDRGNFIFPFRGNQRQAAPPEREPVLYKCIYRYSLKIIRRHKLNIIHLYILNSWTVIPLVRRETSMASLERASIHGDITDFAHFLDKLVESRTLQFSVKPAGLKSWPGWLFSGQEQWATRSTAQM